MDRQDFTPAGPGILAGFDIPADAIKALQQTVKLSGGKIRIPDLLALSEDKDPYYSGTPAKLQAAEWYAEWFGEARGQHVRRVHYRILSPGNVRRPDGMPYENDAKSWNYLQAASRQARYLGLVDPEAVVDRRNPEPHIYMHPNLFPDEPQWEHEVSTTRLDRIIPRLRNTDWLFPLFDVKTEVSGYEYETRLQPYHVEIWAEKTTMNDILMPIARGLHVNYVSGAGYQSITAMVNLLRARVRYLDKPCRVLYVSDYDKSGRNMPRQMSRHMQFWSEKYGSDADIRVEPIVMTAEQAADYPSAPDSDAVELDAMEELTPGRLERIVRESAQQFRDFELPEKIRVAREQAEEVVRVAAEETISEERRGIEEVKAEAEEIYSRYRAPLEQLAAELDAELAPLDARLESLQQAGREKLDAMEPDLPAHPEGETEEDPDDEGWLFQSDRDYLEQLDHFNER